MAVALALAGPAAVLVWGINFTLAHWYFPVYWCSTVSKVDGSTAYCWAGPASFFNWLLGVAFLVFAFNAFLFVVTRVGIGDPPKLGSLRWPTWLRWATFVPLAIAASLLVQLLDVIVSLIIGYYLKWSIYPEWMEKIVSSALVAGALVIIGVLIAPRARLIVAWSLAAVCVVGALAVARYYYVVPGGTDPSWLVTCCIIAVVLGGVGAAFAARELINVAGPRNHSLR
jgi:hypothetical protein